VTTTTCGWQTSGDRPGPSSAEERAEKQMRMIAGVMLSRREVFGIELPLEMQETLDQGSAETKVSTADEHPAGEH
jgi:hypothetical protein